MHGPAVEEEAGREEGRRSEGEGCRGGWGGDDEYLGFGGEDELNVARASHERVDTTVRAVGAAAHFRGLSHLNVLDVQVVHLQACTQRRGGRREGREEGRRTSTSGRWRMVFSSCVGQCAITCCSKLRADCAIPPRPCSLTAVGRETASETRITFSLSVGLGVLEQVQQVTGGFLRPATLRPLRSTTQQQQRQRMEEEQSHKPPCHVRPPKMPTTQATTRQTHEYDQHRTCYASIPAFHKPFLTPLPPPLCDCCRRAAAAVTYAVFLALRVACNTTVVAAERHDV
jgi:hypothetical protein